MRLQYNVGPSTTYSVGPGTRNQGSNPKLVKSGLGPIKVMGVRTVLLSVLFVIYISVFYSVLAPTEPQELSVLLQKKSVLPTKYEPLRLQELSCHMIPKEESSYTAQNPRQTIFSGIAPLLTRHTGSDLCGKQHNMALCICATGSICEPNGGLDKGSDVLLLLIECHLEQNALQRKHVLVCEICFLVLPWVADTNQ